MQMRIIIKKFARRATLERLPPRARTVPREKRGRAQARPDPSVKIRFGAEDDPSPEPTGYLIAALPSTRRSSLAIASSARFTAARMASGYLVPNWSTNHFSTASWPFSRNCRWSAVG